MFSPPSVFQRGTLCRLRTPRAVPRRRGGKGDWARVSRVVKKLGRRVAVLACHLSLYPGFLALLSINCSCEVVLEKNFRSSHAASPSTRKIGSLGGTPTRGGAREGMGVTQGGQCWSRAHRAVQPLSGPLWPQPLRKARASAHAQ